MADPTLPPILPADLLALPTRAGQATALREAGLLTPDGLATLLGQAGPLLARDPAQAGEVAALVAALAAEVGAPALAPRALYLQAQSHAIAGDFEQAQSGIHAARAGYEALGERWEALRTNVGLMNVLGELGDYGAALDAGQEVLDAVGPSPDGDEATLLAALVHQNRGVCWRHMGRYDEALAALTAAEGFFEALGLAERLADLRNNRGIVLLNLGRARAALADFGAAAAFRAGAGRPLPHAQTLINQGAALLLLGEYQRSLETLEAARRRLDTPDGLTDAHVLLLDTADAYLALNLHPEALAAFREAAARLDAAGMAHHRARARWGEGAALAALGRLDEAAQALSEAADGFAAANNQPALADVQLEQAALRHARGEGDGAQRLAEQALALVGGGRWPVQELYARLALASLSDDGAAEAHLRAAQPLAEALALPQARYRLAQRWGQLRQRQGHPDEARHHLEAAVAEIERLRGTLAHEALRRSFLHDKADAYEALLRLHLEGDDEASVARAFATAERARSRALADLLAGVGHADDAAPDGALAAQLADVQADLNALYNQMMGQGAGTLDDLRARIAELEAQSSRLRLQAAATAGADLWAAPLDPATLLAALPPDPPLVAFQVLDDEVLAFVWRDAGLMVHRHLTTLARVRPLLQRLEAQWGRFRAGADFVQRHAAALEGAARHTLNALYTELFAPLEPLLADNREGPRPLVVVPHGPLHRVPFHALHDGAGFLLDRYALSYAPSATVWALGQRRARRADGPAVIFGVPDPAIPAVGEETRAVAATLAGAEVLLDEGATVAALRARAGACRLLHLACHGLFRADNPMFSALRLHDGWLSAADAMALPLDGATVTLSACESGRSEVGGGDEILGLARAFLGAGAASLVVSLWLAPDDSTAALMAEWYTRVARGEGRAGALRAAQQAVRAHFPHPFHWAPFVLMGQR